MNKNYKISIITVTKNSENFLEECILSLDKQSYRNYEHIIIDGCSTDNTINIIKKHLIRTKPMLVDSSVGFLKFNNHEIYYK